jgi:glycosyltransferase involved in cell wall biosynthesis
VGKYGRPMGGDPPLVHFYFLTSEVSSEHIYAQELKDALVERGVRFTDDWREADLVHLFEVNFLTADTLTSFNFPTLFRILRSEVPVVVSLDDLYFIDRPEFTAHPYLYRPNHYAQRWLLERVDRTIAISESVKRTLSAYTDADRIHTVHHGVREAYFPDGSHPTDQGYVLHVSLASERKNPEAVVELAERLDERFVVAGSGWEKEIPRRLRSDDVELKGYVPESELIELYQGASVFYFPTRHEGFGLPVLEAMAAETAVVTSDVYAVPEVTGDAAILCDPEDVDAHLSHVRRLLGNDAERRDLARRATERASEFTWARAASDTERIYESVLSTGRIESTPAR